MKQGYNARLDDHLGAAHGHKSQSMQARRHESEGEERALGNRKYSGDKQMDKKSQHSAPTHHRSTSHSAGGLRGGNTFDQVFANMKASNAAGHKSPNQPMN